MKQPKGIAVVLGVLFGLVIVGAVVGGILLFKSESKTQTPVANTNTALQLACNSDADCISYCGGDPNYQPICGVTTIGAAGSCTCRSTSGLIVPGGNTNVTVNANSNTNVSTNANTNSTVSTTSWKKYTNTKVAYTIKLPEAWNPISEFSGGPLDLVGNDEMVSFEETDSTSPDISLIIQACSRSAPYNCTNRTLQDWKTHVGFVSSTDAALSVSGFTAGRGSSGESYYVRESDRYFIFAYGGKVAEKSVQSILSTFTFLNETAGWKTYESKNTKVKFAFFYPPTVSILSDNPIVISWSDKSKLAFENPQYEVDLFNSADLEVGVEGGIGNIPASQVASCSADGVNGSTSCPEPTSGQIVQKQTATGTIYHQFMTTFVSQVLSNGQLKSEASKPIGPYMYVKDPNSSNYIRFTPVAPAEKYPSGYQDIVEKIFSTFTFTK